MSEQNSYKNSYKLEHRTASLYVQNTGEQRCAPGHSWGPGIRDHYLIHHVISGYGTYTDKNQEYRLGPGDTFLSYPEATNQYAADLFQPWHYVWVGFGGLDAKGILKQTDFSPERPVLRGVKPQEMQKLMMDIYSDYGTSSCNAVALTGRLYLFLSFLMGNTQNLKPASVGGNDCAKTAAEYIVTHYEQPISVEQIAQICSVSQSSLYRSFKQTFNMSPKQFIIRYRIERACELLREGLYSVQEVGISVGIEDPFYFSRLFKEVTGFAPSSYPTKGELHLPEHE